MLHTSTNTLPAPNLQLIAKGDLGSEDETCRLAGLILALVVQVSDGLHSLSVACGTDLSFLCSRINGNSMSSGYKVSRNGYRES